MRRVASTRPLTRISTNRPSIPGTRRPEDGQALGYDQAAATFEFLAEHPEVRLRRPGRLSGVSAPGRSPDSTDITSSTARVKRGSRWFASSAVHGASARSWGVSDR